MATTPEYKGFFESANKPETDEWIEVFVSDWNKEHFGFYAYIDKDTYEKDIKNIWDLIHSFNYGGDIYVELIDHSPSMKEFYEWLYDKGYWADWDALNPKTWKEWWGDKNDC